MALEKKINDPVTIVNLSKEDMDSKNFKDMINMQIKEATVGIKKTDAQKKHEFEVISKLKDEWNKL